MKITFLLSITILTAFSVIVPAARAADIDRKMILSFSQPVEVPGAVLSPGTYMVAKRVDYNRPELMRFTDASGMHVYATIRTISIETGFEASGMRHTPERIEVAFYETRKGAPPAIKALFYPGSWTGDQFLYPKGGPSGASPIIGMRELPAPSVDPQSWVRSANGTELLGSGTGIQRKPEWPFQS